MTCQNLTHKQATTTPPSALLSRWENVIAPALAVNEKAPALAMETAACANSVGRSLSLGVKTAVSIEADCGFKGDATLVHVTYLSCMRCRVLHARSLAAWKEIRSYCHE